VKLEKMVCVPDVSGVPPKFLVGIKKILKKVRKKTREKFVKDKFRPGKIF
jgi:hypothetical protein